jgi:hypothetical protein
MFDTPTKITSKEFALAVDLVRQNLEPTNEREMELMMRIMGASVYMMDRTVGAPDDVKADWERKNFGFFLSGLTGTGRKNLKQVAEQMTFQPTH